MTIHQILDLVLNAQNGMFTLEQRIVVNSTGMPAGEFLHENEKIVNIKVVDTNVVFTTVIDDRSKNPPTFRYGIPLEIADAEDPKVARHLYRVRCNVMEKVSELGSAVREMNAAMLNIETDRAEMIAASVR